MNGTTFRAYLEQMLAPTLALGGVVVMDNLSAHKGAGVGQAIQARGAMLLYLPSYYPDFNPVEQASRRSCEKRRHARLMLCGRPLARSLSCECTNDFNHSGYGRFM